MNSILFCFLLFAGLDPEVCYALRRYDVSCTYKRFDYIDRPARIAKEQLWTKKKVC